MGHCKYCAQDDTKLDSFGYCIKYDCFTRSGSSRKYNDLLQRAKNIRYIPDETKIINIRSYVSKNYYQVRTRVANDIFFEAEEEFGYVPHEIYTAVPLKNRGRWDKDILW